MRYLFFIGALTFALYGGIAEAEEAGEKKAATGQSQVSGVRHLDLGDNLGDSGEEMSGAGHQNLMPPGQSYDRNTGLPNVVPSDTTGEME